MSTLSYNQIIKTGVKMFSKKNIFHLFSFICISTLISCSGFYKQEPNKNKKIMTDKIMKDQKNQIKLYIYPNCPYCKKVINYLKSINQFDNVAIVDVTNNGNMQELLALNNKNTQCPFLYDPEKNIKMLESDDIITYLSTRF